MVLNHDGVSLTCVEFRSRRRLRDKSHASIRDEMGVYVQTKCADGESKTDNGILSVGMMSVWAWGGHTRHTCKRERVLSAHSQASNRFHRLILVTVAAAGKESEMPTP
jgi:hypothetical protein